MICYYLFVIQTSNILYWGYFIYLFLIPRILTKAPSVDISQPVLVNLFHAYTYIYTYFNYFPGISGICWLWIDVQSFQYLNDANISPQIRHSVRMQTYRLKQIVLNKPMINSKDLSQQLILVQITKKFQTFKEHQSVLKISPFYPIMSQLNAVV
jgi:hypothetical protein